MNNKLFITTVLCSTLSGIANADISTAPIAAPSIDIAVTTPSTQAAAPAAMATPPAAAPSVADTPAVHAVAATTTSQLESCYSIAKAGMNDCAAADGSHSCKGYALKDASPVDHILLPSGLCNKIVGASLTPPRV